MDKILIIDDDVQLTELLIEFLGSYKYKIIAKHTPEEGEMWRSFSKVAFVRALQRLIPEITAEDLEEAPAGIRAQAVLPNGKLVDDFLIQQNKNMINVGNAPSPAATSSLNIGKHIVGIVAKRF